MRHELVGYMLGALDDAETRQVESTISRDTRLQEDLRLLKKSIEPLSVDGKFLDPPLGLAQRTCEYVERHRANVLPGRRTSATSVGAAAVGLSEGGAGPGARSWTLLDFAVAAGILVALGVLVLPAINHGRFTAQIAACQNKLREIGTALHDYSRNHDGLIPEIPQSGNFAVAGVYAPKLLEAGLVSDPQTFVCNSSATACREQASEIPTWGKLVELEKSNGDELDRVLAKMGGSYAYNLGYVADGNYYTTSLGRRTRRNYAVMADAPCPRRGFAQSSNHAGNGQNVLFEDLHVGYLNTCQVPGPAEDFYRNDEGEMAAGTHVDDAVVGHSLARPLASR
jgi:hypothetical protein